MTRSLTCVLLILIAEPLRAGDPNGLPYLQNYTTKDYNAGYQNWAIVQDARGVIYVGNNKGILEFDGAAWRLIETPRKTTVRSLAVDENGRVFVGAVGELGYLEPDARGTTRFVGLEDSIDGDHGEFLDVWDTNVTDDGVYFTMTGFLVRWSNGTMKSWPLDPDAFDVSRSVDGQFYIHNLDAGLMTIKNDSLVPVPGGESLIGMRIFVMLPFPGNRILIGTQEDGLFLSDGISIRRFATSADAFFTTANVYCGARVTDNLFAIGTTREGVVTFDTSGTVQKILNKNSGLQDYFVWYLYADRDKGLWLALDNGIAHVEMVSPFSVFDERLGLKGSVESVARHLGKLYVATSQGLYVLVETGTGLDQQSSFKPVPGIATQTWHLLSVGRSLLVATNSGVHELTEKGYPQLLTENTSLFLHRSRRDSNRVFVGKWDGVSSLRKTDGKWLEEGSLEGPDGEVRSIVETEAGYLWLGTEFANLTRVDFPDGFTLKPKVTKFDSSHGLPTHGAIHIYTIKGTPVIATSIGLFGYRESEKRFHHNPFQHTSLSFFDQKDLFPLTVDHNGVIWAYFPNQLGRAIPEGDSYHWEPTPFSRLASSTIYAILPEQDGSVWFGSVEGLIRYDATVEGRTFNHPVTLVRRVATQSDSIVFGGWSRNGLPPSLSHDHNALRFEYSLTSYDHPDANRFRTYLEDFDRGWSEWTEETKRDYTNLPEGRYVFHVLGRSSYGIQTLEDTFAFEIQPPWQRSTMAYIMYFVLFISILYVGVKSWVRVLEKRNKELESKIRERTREVSEKNEILDQQYRELEQKNQQIRQQQAQIIQAEKLSSLGNMVAGIAHEFNNPINVVHGNLDYVNESVQKIVELADRVTDIPDRGEYDELKKSLKDSLRSSTHAARRIIDIVQELRSFSKLDEAVFKPVNINRELDAILSLFIKQHEDIQLKTGYGEIPEISCFASQLNQCLINILYNAVQAIRKAETNGTLNKGDGQISITTALLTNNRVELKISDNGCGIPESIREKVFDPFFTTKPVGKGKGLGLSEAYGIVEKHGGQITVSSVVNEGTSIRIELPAVHKEETSE